MTEGDLVGRILSGDPADIRLGIGRFLAQPVDEERLHEGLYPYSDRETTLAAEVSAEGPGTFDGRRRRTVSFAPSTRPGWWIRRTDLPDQFPIPVSPRSIRSAARNIVLRAGSDANQLRMVEHIVALRLGMGVDDVEIRVASGAPASRRT